MGSGGEEERVVEELARLSSLARRTAAFLAAAASSYSFFSFGMGIVGFVLVAIAYSMATGVREGLAGALGVVAGTAVALALVWHVSGPVWRYLVSRGFTRAIPGRMSAAVAYTAFPAGFGAAYSITPLAPPWYPAIAWYPGLAISFALLYLAYRGMGAEAKSLLLASTLIASTTPLVVWAEVEGGAGAVMASGLVLINYLAAGSYSLRVAARRLFEEQSS